MSFTEQQRAFLEQNRGAAMITIRADGTPTAVRVGVALIDGHLWSSGTQNRRRTAFLRGDPRATVFVFEAGYRFLTIESKVTILDGPDAAAQNVRLFRVMQGRSCGPLSWSGSDYSEDDFLALMDKEQRLIYQFEPARVYGML